MIYLTYKDFLNHLGKPALEQIIDGNSDLLDNSEQIAIGVIRDLLGGMYDIEAELELAGTNDRHMPFVFWSLNLAAYELYRQIPDDEVPERAIKDYDDTMQTLRNIGLGKTPTRMKPISGTDGAKRVFRMNSNDSKTHNML